MKLTGGPAFSVSILDISPRVLEQVQRARARAAKSSGYVIQLPRDVARPWPSGLIAYWNSLGDQVAAEVPPLRPPEIFPGLETRAVQIRPDVENVASMLKPGGILLSNDRLPELAPASLRLAGVTIVPFDAPGVSARQVVGWYGKR